MGQGQKPGNISPACKVLGTAWGMAGAQRTARPWRSGQKWSQPRIPGSKPDSGTHMLLCRCLAAWTMQGHGGSWRGQQAAPG